MEKHKGNNKRQEARFMETVRLIDDEVTKEIWSTKWIPADTADATTSKTRRLQRSRKIWLLHGILLLLSSFLGMVGTATLALSLSTKQHQNETMWSPILEAVTVRKTRFNETFMYPTKYPSKFSRGLTSEEEWRKWTAHQMLNGQNGSIAVSGETVDRIAQLYNHEWKQSVVTLSHGDETKYMGQIAMFHHLHCLNMLRHAVHPELYGPATGANHLDHCIESLREVLMCNPGGSEVILFHWMEDSDKPYPDYNTWHQCRNPNEVLDWALENAVKIRGPLTKPQGVFELKSPPY